MSTFSYAQAAKGQFKPTPAAPQSVSSQAASTTSSQSHEATAATTSAPSDAPSTTSNDIDATGIPEKPQAQTESASKVDDSMTSPPAKEGESSGGVSSAEIVRTPTQRTETSIASTERRSRGPGSSSRASDTSEVRKPRKSKRTKNEKDAEPAQEDEKEKEPEPPKIELSEAPIPSVNIWVQRREAQAAKLKPSGGASSGPLQSVTSVSRPVASAASTASNTDEKAKVNGVHDYEHASTHHKGVVNGVKNEAPKKASESSRDDNENASKRVAPRGSRVSERAEKSSIEALPTVGDVAAWPTPETAVHEIKSLDKVDRAQESHDSKEETGPKERTKWVSMPYVPSVNFQTPLPTRGARGGRGGARGGRESSTRGSHSATGASADRSQPNAPSKTTSSPNDRTNDAAAGSRASSAAAHPNKRASIDVQQNNRDIRRPYPGTGAASVATANGKDDAHKHAAESVATANHQAQPNTANYTGSEQRAERGPRPGDGFKNFSQTSVKDANQHSHREGGSRDRQRGGHRGRGGHAGANGHGHHSHNPFAPNGQTFAVPSHNGGRQNSYPAGYPPAAVYGNPYTGPNPAGNARHSNRANSTSSVPFYSRAQPNGSNGASRLPPIQTASGAYDPSMQQPVSAYPAPPSYPHDLLPLVLTQLEYYFSIDNLCKDVFLRKQMDSQGFVRLEVIASFKRMQDLTKDLDLIRAACEESQTIEFVIGADDHRERIRRKESWEQWVFPLGDRHEAVNYDHGPSSFWLNDRRRYMPYGHTPYMYSPYGLESPAMFSPNGVNGIDPHYAQYMSSGAPYNHGLANGVNGHASNESQLSAAVPEFSPAGALNGVPTFPGQQHEDLHVGISDQERTNGLGSGSSQSKAQPLTNGVHEESLAQSGSAHPALVNGVNGSLETASH